MNWHTKLYRRVRLLSIIVFPALLPLGSAAPEKNPQMNPASAKREAPAKGWTVYGKLIERSRSVNAADFGLISESTADQSDSLAKAFKHATSTPGIDTVFVPAGRYFFAKIIVLPPGINLLGDGPGKTILDRNNSKDYLLRGVSGDYRQAAVANLTLHNDGRLLLMRGLKSLRFHNVEFSGGIVRFEECSDLVIEGSLFNHTSGKAGYASSKCENVRIIHNTFRSTTGGSINLSGHKNSYVAYNHITSPSLINSGYAGIRLPNGATDNLVEYNFVENHGRGLFVLSGSARNTLRYNTVKRTNSQGAFIQGPDNVFEGNTIIDAGDEAIYVGDGHSPQLPAPSPGTGNKILRNIIYDTQPHDASRFIGLKIATGNNVVKDNVVSKKFGREFKAINPDAGNEEKNNNYVLDVPIRKAR